MEGFKIAVIKNLNDSEDFIKRRKSMPIISLVGRKKPRIRILLTCMYVILTIGAVTMVYPFLLMLGMSITSEVDKNELRIIPTYVTNNVSLYQKYLDHKYVGDMKRYNEQICSNYFKFKEVLSPEIDIKSAQINNRIKDYEEFKKTLPYYYLATGFTELRTAGRPTIGRSQRMYQNMLMKKFKNSLDEFNKVYIEENLNWQLVVPPREQPWLREYQYDNSIKMKDWLKFKAELESMYTYPVSGNGLWTSHIKTKYNNEIAKLNEKYKTDYKDFNEIRLSKKAPESEIKADWEEFVRTRMPLRYLRFAKGAEDQYLKFIKAKYKNNISMLNKLYKTEYKSFEKINFPDVGSVISGPQLEDLSVFVKKDVSLKFIYTETAENLYEEYLNKKYKTVEDINKEYGATYKVLSEILPPYAETDWIEVVKSSGNLRKYFIFKNYQEVFDYIILHGRAIVNTMFYCSIMVLSVLTINPLCAYVLSRFNLSYSYKILLFLLATMAFPYEVAMIPNFILLKSFGMLNTFWALILPGLANGFSIFVLKGFFDSLSKDMFEAAKIDGASEMRVYWQIVLPLTKPVMAYLALGAFTGAYGAFMYALIVCQNPDMWTIMVWLYEMQNWAPPFLILAALVVIAMPTLLVFVFFQNVIIRGIILPLEQ